MKHDKSVINSCHYNGGRNLIAFQIYNISVFNSSDTFIQIQFDRFDRFQTICFNISQLTRISYATDQHWIFELERFSLFARQSIRSYSYKVSFANVWNGFFALKVSASNLRIASQGKRKTTRQRNLLYDILSSYNRFSILLYSDGKKRKSKWDMAKSIRCRNAAKKSNTRMMFLWWKLLNEVVRPFLIIFQVHRAI